MTDLPPVRCFTCGRVIAAKLDQYWNLLKSDTALTEREACDRVGIPRKRYCCRGLFMCTMPPQPLSQPGQIALNNLSPMVVFQTEQLRAAELSRGGRATEAEPHPGEPFPNTDGDPTGGGASGTGAPRRIRCM